MPLFKVTFLSEITVEFEASSGMEAQVLATDEMKKSEEFKGVKILSIVRSDRAADDAVECAGCKEAAEKNDITLHPIFRLAAATPPVVVDVDPNEPGPRYA